MLRLFVEPALSLLFAASPASAATIEFSDPYYRL